MKKTNSALILALLSFLFCVHSKAFSSGSWYGGISYYAQNSLGRVSNSETGSTGMLGEASFPLLLKYDYEFMNSWFLSPQLNYTLLSRSSPGDTAKVTMTEVLLPMGGNFAASGDSVFDWSLGLAYIKYDVQGAGGTVVMNNGTSNAVFAIPGGSATIQKVGIVLGTSCSFDRSRMALDLIVENMGSSSKRTESLSLSYAYKFAGGR